MTLKNTEVWQEEDLISRYLKPDLYNFLTSTDIKLLLEKHFPSLRTNTKRIGQSLKKLGFDQEMRKINGKIMRVYRVQVDL
jgi:hypothetical protein